MKLGKEDKYNDIIYRLNKTTQALSECIDQNDILKKSIMRKYRTIEKLRYDCYEENINELRNEIINLRKRLSMIISKEQKQ